MKFSLLLLASAATLSRAQAFDIREATVATIHQALFSNQTSCVGVVQAYLSRINAINPTINAIISLDPALLTKAAALDAALANATNTQDLGPLFCIPILLKDNYDTSFLPTTAGSLSLAQSQPTVDAPVVRAFLAAGALIMGKSNLHEYALEGLSVSSVGGQTHNPFDLTRTPGGSSGGTGAAVAAGLACFGTGTDTVNSLRSPASSNSIWSLRATWGLVDRTGVVPISYTQDVIGPIARSVSDLAVALTVMASAAADGSDQATDNATAVVPANVRGIDYTRAPGSLASIQGVRLGLVEGFFNKTPSDETTPVLNLMAAAVARLQAEGATVVTLNDTFFDSTTLANTLDTQRAEFGAELNAYLQRSNLGGSHPNTIQEVYANKTGGGKYVVIPAQYEYVSTALRSSPQNATYNDVLAGIANLKMQLALVFQRENLDALIYPEQQHLVVPIGSPSQSGRNGEMGALTGHPVITVPIGLSPATASAPIGVPVGMEVLGQPWTEEWLLGFGSVLEGWNLRRTPQLADMAVPVTATTVPTIVPNATVPPEYPVGVLPLVFPSP